MIRPVIEITGLKKRFGRVVALRDVTLRIEGGSICGLLGGNGAGKTTLLKSIMGLVRPSSGHVAIGGEDTRSPKIYETLRAAGYLPQTPILYEHLTGREYLGFLGGMYDLSRECLRLGDQMIDDLGMATSANHPCPTYVKGIVTCRIT